MNKKVLWSCLGSLLVCGLVAFVASVVFGQLQASSVTPTFTPPSTSRATVTAAAPVEASLPPVIVTTRVQPAATVTALPFQTATPGLAPLGTLSYPLTVTAELALDATRVQDYRARLFATRTAAAGQAIDAHAALTATAQKGR